MVEYNWFNKKYYWSNYKDTCCYDYYIKKQTQQTRDAIPIPVQCWPRVRDWSSTGQRIKLAGHARKSNNGGNDQINAWKNDSFNPYRLNAGSVSYTVYQHWSKTKRTCPVRRVTFFTQQTRHIHRMPDLSVGQHRAGMSCSLSRSYYYIFLRKTQNRLPTCTLSSKA